MTDTLGDVQGKTLDIRDLNWIVEKTNGRAFGLKSDED